MKKQLILSVIATTSLFAQCNVIASINEEAETIILSKCTYRIGEADSIIDVKEKIIKEVNVINSNYIGKRVDSELQSYRDSNGINSTTLVTKQSNNYMFSNKFDDFKVENNVAICNITSSTKRSEILKQVRDAKDAELASSKYAGKTNISTSGTDNQDLLKAAQKMQDEEAARKQRYEDSLKSQDEFVNTIMMSNMTTKDEIKDVRVTETDGHQPEATIYRLRRLDKHDPSIPERDYTKIVSGRYTKTVTFSKQAYDELGKKYPRDGAVSRIAMGILTLGLSEVAAVSHQLDYNRDEMAILGQLRVNCVSTEHARLAWNTDEMYVGMIVEYEYQSIGKFIGTKIQERVINIGVCSKIEFSQEVSDQFTTRKNFKIKGFKVYRNN